MIKKEFMKELERRLSKIPENEKRDALNYYEDYFAEAAIDDDMLVPDTMGTPEDIAKQIIDEVVQKEQSEEYFDDKANVTSEKNEYVPYYRRGENYTTTKQRENSVNDKDNSQTGKTSVKNKDAKIVAVILLVITCPVWGSIVIAVLSCVFAVIVALGAVVFGLGVSGIALIGTAFLSGSFAAGSLLAGTGLVLLAVTCAMIIPFVLFCFKFLPWVVARIVKQCKRLFGNGKEQA